MKILVAGGGTCAADLIEALARPGNYEITHCTNETCALAELLRQEYDWAIISGNNQGGDKTDNARLIRAMASVLGQKAGPATPPVLEQARPGDGASCGVEWTDDGILQLHCCLHTLLKTAGARQKPVVADLGEILFEYHAPCSKERSRNG